MTVEESSNAMRRAQIERIAERVFNDSAKAQRWLNKPMKTLGGETLLACLATEAGTRIVEEMLV